MSADPLAGVRTKIERAKTHLKELESQVATFLESKPFILEMEEDARAGSQLYRVRIRQPIPSCWAGIVGDVIHNLRSALDLLAVALVIANGHTSKSAITETYFPIAANRESFSTGKIRRASPSALRIIRRLKPYKGGADAFWQLHQLDILDKHSLLIPVGAAHTHVGIRFRMAVPWEQEPIVFPPIFLNPAYRQFPLEDGAEVFRFNAGEGTKPEPGDVQCVFTIAFGEGQIVDGEPLVPTLRNFIEFTKRIVAIFERHFFGHRQLQQGLASADKGVD